MHRGVPVLLVQVHKDFRVAAGGEAMSLRLEAGAQLAVIVDLAVEDDDESAVFVRDRLMAARHVDDAEPADAEADAVGEIEPFVVRTAVHHGPGHAAQDGRVDGAKDTADAAHYPASRAAS